MHTNTQIRIYIYINVNISKNNKYMNELMQHDLETFKVSVPLFHCGVRNRVQLVGFAMMLSGLDAILE